MWFEERGKILVSMPGVPHEMMAMMQDYVLPEIQKKGNLPSIVHQTLLTAGLGESFLAQKLENFEKNLPSHIKLAYLPKLGQVRLRLSGYGDSKPLLEKEVEEQKQKIMELIPENLIWIGDGTLSQAILQKLDSLSKTLSLAESCTGGFISREITSIPGSSRSYLGGVVPYSNSLKTKLLGVKPSTLEQFGAVSEETVREMVSGLILHLGSDFGLATSGIAGPDGGTPEKPVGTVWIAWGSTEKIEAKKFQFGKDRLINIERSATVALTQFLTFLKEEK
jgi:nicotinamide-nucleotide amidase